MSAPSSVLSAVDALPKGRKGFIELGADREGLTAEAGRRWIWSDSRLTLGGFGRWDWDNDWNAGVGLRFEF